MEISTLIIFVSFILIAFFYDIKFRKIPNKLILIYLPIALVNSLIVGKTNGLLNSVAAMFIAGGLFLLLYLFKALGAGDVKLFIVIGAITGIEYSLYCIFYTIIMGGLLAILILVTMRTPLRRVAEVMERILMSFHLWSLKPLETYKVTKATTMPFMLAVLPGAVAAFYYVYLIG